LDLKSIDFLGLKDIESCCFDTENVGTKFLNIFLYFHGGGFVSGDTNGALCKEIAEKYANSIGL
jgi:hypothetical protein